MQSAGQEGVGRRGQDRGRKSYRNCSVLQLIMSNGHRSRSRQAKDAVCPITQREPLQLQQVSARLVCVSAV